MKKTILILGLVFAFLTTTSAMAQTNASGTAQDEVSGKAVFEKLQSKELACSNLSNDDFDKLGDYYMGQMMGTSHSAMDELMIQRLGESNEGLMHIAMGKRFSGCDPSAQFPAQGASFLPMMGMMGGYNGGMMGNYGGSLGNGWSYNSMMGGALGGWQLVSFVILLVIAAIIVLFLANYSRNPHRHPDPMSILKERYAKGEIDKKEFEEKTQELKKP